MNTDRKLKTIQKLAACVRGADVDYDGLSDLAVSTIDAATLLAIAVDDLDAELRIGRGKLPRQWRAATCSPRCAAALAASAALVSAYKCGQDCGGSIDWSDLDAAYQAALRATTPAAAV